MPDYSQPGAAAGGFGGENRGSSGGSFGRTGVAALVTGGDIAGDTADIYGRENVFGRRPDVADFTPLDLTEEQRKALEGNLSNADSIEQLLNRFVPGFSDMLAQGTANSMSLLRGEIPKDVQDQVNRSSAYQALQGGYAGSGMSHALTARDLGRTSLDLLNMGNNSAQQWTKLAQSSYSPFIIDTAQQAQVTAANNAGEQQNQQYKYNVAAAPDPAAAGIYAMNSAIGMQLMQMGGSMAGGAMAGGGGGGGAAAAGAAGGGNSGGGQYNYAGQGANGQPWQYNAQTQTYMPIQRATWGGT